MIKTLGLIALLFAAPAFADCYCACMNGVNQAICDSPRDLRPICSQSVCQIEPPAIAPIQPPTLTPPGYSHCVQKRVWNYILKEYHWETVCDNG